MIIFFFLLIPRVSRVLAGIERWQDGYEKYYSVINHGRMHIHSVLMFLQNKDLPECIEFCIKHRQCVTVSYCADLRQCELNDKSFNDNDGDKAATGWINYSTPSVVHGGFSDWMNSTECSTTCGPGTMVFNRFCDNPRPEFGGDWCRGDYQKLEPCDLAPCPEDNIAVGKPSKQSSNYYFNEDTHGAKLANDGDFATRSYTKKQQDPYWIIDLEKPITIRSMTIYFPRHEMYKTKIYSKSHLVVSTSKTSSDNWSTCKDIGRPGIEMIEVKCDDDSDKVRYIRIQNRIKKGYLSLQEFQVFKWQTEK